MSEQKFVFSQFPTKGVRETRVPLPKKIASVVNHLSIRELSQPQKMFTLKEAVSSLQRATHGEIRVEGDLITLHISHRQYSHSWMLLKFGKK